MSAVSDTRSRPRRPRRRHSLRKQLSYTLIATALVSLLIVGIVNFFAARTLLEDGAREQLVEVAESRVNSIETGVDGALNRASITASTPAVANALSDFNRAFAELDGAALDPADESAVDEFYSSTVVDPLAALGVDVVLDDVTPSGATEYLQRNYTIPIAEGLTPSPDSETAYARAISDHDEFLAGIADQPEIDDVLLISPAGEVVYSASKLIDLGTDLTSGPLADSSLATAALDGLPRVRAGDGVLADFELYLPTGGEPEAFALASVQDGSEVIGAVALRLSVDALNSITTANGDWEAVGLGEGETYVVGPNRTLSSESRRWIEDPEDYLDAVDDDPLLAERIQILGSPIGLQPVDTEPVRVATDGNTFEGTATNFLGQRTFSYARQILVGDVRWVIVAEQPVSALRAPLLEYASRLGLVLAIVLPLAAIIGYVIADRLTRSIPPVVAMAEAIAGGERNLDPPDLGRNEFGDLARQLERRAGELGRQEADLAAEFERRRQLLLSVLPARLVDESAEIGSSDESVYLGTVIAVMVEATGDGGADERVAELLGRFGRAAEADAQGLDIERVRTASDRFLFVCGADSDDDGAEQAVAFAADLIRLAETMSEDPDEDVRIDVSIGMATGAVATGVLERGNLTFTVWGNPVRRALAIVSLAEADEPLLDSSTADALGDDVATMPATDVVALDGEPMRLFTINP